MNKKFLSIDEIEEMPYDPKELRASLGELVRLDCGAVVVVVSIPSSLNIHDETMIMFSDASCGLLSDCDSTIVEILGKCSFGLYE